MDPRCAKCVDSEGVRHKVKRLPQHCQHFKIPIHTCYVLYFFFIDEIAGWMKKKNE